MYTVYKQPTKSDDSYKILDGTCMTSDDKYVKYSNAILGTDVITLLENCKDLCTKDSKCQGFTFLDDSKRCILYGENQPNVGDPAASPGQKISKGKISVSSPTAKCYLKQSGSSPNPNIPSTPKDFIEKYFWYIIISGSVLTFLLLLLFLYTKSIIILILLPIIISSLVFVYFKYKKDDDITK